MPKIKKQWEVRYFVTAVASVPLYKCHSKTETYKQAAKPGWGTVEWYSAADDYKNPVARDRSDKTQQLCCDEDCSASLYTKNGGYFGIFPCEEINAAEMPKQAECAAIITSDSCGLSFWAEDFSRIHIFVTYDESGLIDSYRVEYDDATIYDGEVEISFDDLYEQAEEDWRGTYRAEIPGTVEYQFKQEADKLAQESGEAWMNAEEREKFRQVCYKIDQIKSAWDFLCTMSLLEYDYDKKIINAARKFKKCFNFMQYEKPQEAARREERLEDYEKYAFTVEDTTAAAAEDGAQAEQGAPEAAANGQQDTPSAASLIVIAADEMQAQARQITAAETESGRTRKGGGGAGPPPPEKEEQGVNSGAAV